MILGMSSKVCKVLPTDTLIKRLKNTDEWLKHNQTFDDTMTLGNTKSNIISELFVRNVISEEDFKVYMLSDNYKFTPKIKESNGESNTI